MNYNEIKYILEKYTEFEGDECWFNPNINPEIQVIPKCSQCSLDYNNFKDRTDIADKMEVEWKHPSSCLWYDWFIDRIKDTVKNPKFVKKRK